MRKLLWNAGLALLLGIVAAGMIAFGALAAVFVMIAAAWEFAGKVYASTRETVRGGWEVSRK